MNSYHVFFSAKADADERRVIALAHAFLSALKAEDRVRGYRILRVSNSGSFPALPRFQAIIDYASSEELEDSFAFMREPMRMKEGPHGELMDLVSDFKVSFTSDV